MWRDIAACSWSSASTKQSASISLCVVTHWPPNISHPPTTDLFFFFFSLFTPFLRRGGVGARLDGENISVGNRDVESAELIYGKYCKNCSRRHSKNFFPSVSPGLSPFFFFFFFFSSLSFSRWLSCVVALRFDGKNPEEGDGGICAGRPECNAFYFHPLNHLVAPDFYCREWGVLIHWRAAEFIYKGCGQVCGKNSHSFRSVR